MKWRVDGNLGPSHRTMLLSNGALGYPTTIYYTAIHRSIIMFIVDYIIGYSDIKRYYTPFEND